MKRISGLAHCCHHDKHWEFCWDFDKRVQYIKKFKPKEEQELRLKLFQIVPDNMLPGRDSLERVVCIKAREACIKAGEACLKAWEAYLNDKVEEACIKTEEEAFVKSWKAYHKAEEAYLNKFGAELDKLHSEMFPDCNWNGKTIFPEKVNGAKRQVFE